MAIIDPKKLLNPSGDSSTSRGSNTFYSSGFFKVAEDISNIKENVVKIEDVLKKSIKINLKQLELSRRDLENRKRNTNEEKKESRKKVSGLDKVKKFIPGLSLIDRAKQFLGSIFAGFLVLRLVKLLPKLLEILKFLKPVGQFIFDFAAGILDKVATGIEFAYNTVDTISNTVKNVFGEDAQKKLNGFLSAFTKFANIAIIAMMLASGGSNPLDRKFKGPERKGFDRSGRRVNTRTQRRYRQRYGDRRFRERFGQRNLDRLNRPPRPSATPSTGGASRPTGGPPGAVQSGAQRAVQRGVTKVAGRTAGRIAGRIPIVGPLIDFGIRTLIFKEPLGKAAAGAVGAGVGQALGAWIGGTIGGVAGSVVPILGNAIGGAAGATIGSILGGLVGDQIGVSLYNIIDQSDSEPVQKKSGGGSTNRKIKNNKTKSRKKIKEYNPDNTNPGKSIGRKRLKEIYNNNFSIIRGISKASKSLKKKTNTILSKIVSLGLDLSLGQKPSDKSISDLSESFASIINFYRDPLNVAQKLSSGGSVENVESVGKDVIVKGLRNEFNREIKNAFTDVTVFGSQESDNFANSLASFFERLTGIQISTREPSTREPSTSRRRTPGTSPGTSPGSVVPAAAPLSGSSKFARITGDSGSVKYGGRENASLTVAYSPLAKGVRGASIISGKGYRRTTGTDHKGYDIAAPPGTPLYAYLPGKVLRAAYDRSYGYFIEWKDSEYGQTHFFGHMIAPSPLKAGDSFKQGDSLGRVGSTGRSDGPHLHWEIGPQKSEIDPGNWVNTHPLKKDNKAKIQTADENKNKPDKVSSNASYEQPSTTTIAVVEKTKYVTIG